MLVISSLDILCRRPGDRRRNAQCRVTGVVPYWVPMLAYALFNYFCRRSAGTRRDILCR